MGYVGFSVAFAFAIAALLSGRLDAAWARWSRPWTTVAWVFLTLGIALGSPRYVSSVDPVTNTITLGRREDLETSTFTIEDVRFISDDPPPAPFRAAVRIRHRAEPVPATVRPATHLEPSRGGSWVVDTDTPVWAIAPGQAAVLYDGDACLGGGRIARTPVAPISRAMVRAPATAGAAVS